MGPGAGRRAVEVEGKVAHIWLRTRLFDVVSMMVNGPTVSATDDVLVTGPRCGMNFVSSCSAFLLCDTKANSEGAGGGLSLGPLRRSS